LKRYYFPANIVSDFGIGLDNDQLNNVFQPFYTTKPDSIGIGLSINRLIIRSHGGKIWAEKNPDYGTTFYFTLQVYNESSK